MSRVIRVLSIDGGGIRGIIPAKILIRVEELLREYSQDQNAKIGDFFDLIAGTSTGGIITALCLCPEEKGSSKAKYSAKDMLNLYLEHGEAIFTRSFKTRYLDYLGLFNPLYQKEALENIIVEYMGDYRLSDLIKPCLIPTYDIEQGKANFFNKMKVIKGSNEDYLIRDVVRATTAAPTYFPVAKSVEKKLTDESFIDGSLFANNPALCAYIEATKFPCEPRQREIHILSLGTGARDKHYPYRYAKQWGRLGWVVPVIDIYGSASSQTVDHQLRMLYERKDLMPNYLRIEPHLNEFDVDKGLDNPSHKNMEALQKVGEKMIEDYDQELRIFIKKICDSQEISPHCDLYRKPK